MAAPSPLGLREAPGSLFWPRLLSSLACASIVFKDPVKTNSESTGDLIHVPPVALELFSVDIKLHQGGVALSSSADQRCQSYHIPSAHNVMLGDVQVTSFLENVMLET